MLLCTSIRPTHPPQCPSTRLLDPAHYQSHVCAPVPWGPPAVFSWGCGPGYHAHAPSPPLPAAGIRLGRVGRRAGLQGEGLVSASRRHSAEASHPWTP